METAARKRCFVLIAAGGNSERFGGDLPKQYCEIHGKPVLRHTIEIFSGLAFVNEIRVVINPSHRLLYDKAVAGLDLSSPVEGGASRQESVYNGLKTVDAREDDILLIHDAARPLANPADIEKLYEVLQDNNAATLAVPESNTLVKSTDRLIGEPVDRENVWSLATPQGFSYGLIMKAHENAIGKNYTDDTALVKHIGHDVVLIECNKGNLKITSSDDLKMAQQLLNIKTETRIGNGFDVHAFTDAGNGIIRLCGTDLPHDKSLEGHSDADVALHALTDALFGAAGAGDIGGHFPDSSGEWKNADSSLFIKKACNIIDKNKGSIINADITIICESPKIGPYKEKMRTRVSQLLGIAKQRVNIKATSTEGLGFTGRGEGIAAQAVVNVEFSFCYSTGTSRHE